jgi:hypothetical protein
MLGKHQARRRWSRWISTSADSHYFPESLQGAVDGIRREYFNLAIQGSTQSKKSKKEQEEGSEAVYTVPSTGV